MRSEKIRTSVTRRGFIRGLGLMSAASALAACAKEDGGDEGKEAGPAATPLLAIIHTNDVHGHVVATQGGEGTKGNFSLAAVPALKRQWEEQGYEVVLVDAGDATQGAPIVDTSNGARGISLMNACGYDLMCVGNHEFGWGKEALEQNERSADFPFLSANVLLRETGDLRFAANKLVTLKDGTLVGFFGLTTASTYTTTNPKNVSDVEFLEGDDLIACAQAQVDDLRGQGAEIVVCVEHLGSESEDGGSSRDVLEGVRGIDLFIDGHDHQEINEEVAGALLVETGCNLHNIGVVAIDEGVPAEELVRAGEFDGLDEATQKLVEAAEADTDAYLSEKMGTTSFVLDGEFEPNVCGEETNLGDFLCDAFVWLAEREIAVPCDGAVLNGGGIRSSVGVGDITLKEIKTVLPFDNWLVVVKVSGAQLVEAIEAACQDVGTESSLSAFPQVSGIEFTIDASVPYERGPRYPGSTFSSPAAVGARVTIESVGGRAFDESETYSIATINFLTAGGDTYHAFKEAADAEEPVAFGFDYGAFASYLKEECAGVVPEQYETTQGRITIVGGK